jgi:hypothetical protein
MLSLPDHIARRIREVIAAQGPYAIDDEARTHGAIALMGTIGAIWMLRPDGSLWDADADWGKPLTPLAEELHTMAIAAGVERHPWLAEILPERPAHAVECTAGQGTGRIVPPNALPSSGGFLCSACSALGWRVEALGADRTRSS